MEKSRFNFNRCAGHTFTSLGSEWMANKRPIYLTEDEAKELYRHTKVMTQLVWVVDEPTPIEGVVRIYIPQIPPLVFNSDDVPQAEELVEEARQSLRALVLLNGLDKPIWTQDQRLGAMVFSVQLQYKLNDPAIHTGSSTSYLLCVKGNNLRPHGCEPSGPKQLPRSSRILDIASREASSRWVTV